MMQGSLHGMEETIGRVAGTAMRRNIMAGAHAYDRIRHLPRLVHLLPDEIEALGKAGSTTIVQRLSRALRAERLRGRAGHWTYDLNRHIALHQALLAERARLRSAAPKQKGAPTGAPASQMRQSFAISGGGAADPAPSSSPAPSARRHSWAQPSGNPPAAPTFRDTLPATDRNESADDASTT